jgi:hypothetical protein
MIGIFRGCSQKTPMTHSVNRVTLSNLYQSDDPNVNKQVLKKPPLAKKERAPFHKNLSAWYLLFERAQGAFA